MRFLSSLVFLAVLGACAEPPAAERAPDGLAAAPLVSLTATDVVPGATFHAEVLAPAGYQVRLLGSAGGLGTGPTAGGVTLEIVAPVTVIGESTADAGGVATFDLPVPAGAPLGSTFGVQAVARGAVAGSSWVASNAVAVTVRTNEAPVAPGLAEIVPNPLGELDDLRCVMDTPASDPDGDPITYEVSWLRWRSDDPVNHPNYDAGGTLSVVQRTRTTEVTGLAWELAASVTEYADRYVCRVTASDGIATSAPVYTNAMAVQDLSGPATPTLDPIALDGNVAVLTGTCPAFPVDCAILHTRCTAPGGQLVDVAQQPQCAFHPGVVDYEVRQALTSGTWTCTTQCEDIGANVSLLSQPRKVSL